MNRADSNYIHLYFDEAGVRFYVREIKQTGIYGPYMTLTTDPDEALLIHRDHADELKLAEAV